MAFKHNHKLPAPMASENRTSGGSSIPQAHKAQGTSKHTPGGPLHSVASPLKKPC